MQRISQVLTRIQELRVQAERPPLPGHFRALLDARMARQTAAKPATAPAVMEGVEPQPAWATMAAWSHGNSVTLGAMLGTATSMGVGPRTAPSGAIMSAAELDLYLMSHGVQDRNGRLHAAELVPVSGTWHGNGKLLPPAAAAWEEMRRAAALDGINLQAIDTYRTWESQDRAHQAHLRGEKKANVLPPGHSEHGNGLAVDLTNGHLLGPGDAEWDWVRANGRNFGWYPISNESWHWEFRGLGA